MAGSNQAANSLTSERRNASDASELIGLDQNFFLLPLKLWLNSTILLNSATNRATEQQPCVSSAGTVSKPRKEKT